ncbi:hypothetical protein ACVIN2_005816 [Bradyrhizobium sp. USDA 3650]
MLDDPAGLSPFGKPTSLGGTRCTRDLPSAASIRRTRPEPGSPATRLGGAPPSWAARRASPDRSARDAVTRKIAWRSDLEEIRGKPANNVGRRASPAAAAGRRRGGAVVDYLMDYLGGYTLRHLHTHAGRTRDFSRFSARRKWRIGFGNWRRGRDSRTNLRPSADYLDKTTRAGGLRTTVTATQRTTAAISAADSRRCPSRSTPYWPNSSEA